MGRLGYVPSLLCAEFVMGRVCHVPSLPCAEFAMCRVVPKSLEIQKGSKVKWSVHKLRELLNEYISARERAEQQVMNDNKYASSNPLRFRSLGRGWVPVKPV